jgi:hypothetical protein
MDRLEIERESRERDGLFDIGRISHLLNLCSRLKIRPHFGNIHSCDVLRDEVDMPFPLNAVP